MIYFPSSHAIVIINIVIAIATWGYATQGLQ
jgi:hypothetical protein